VNGKLKKAGSVWFRFFVLTPGIVALLGALTPASADPNWLDARHANMRRYYEIAHKPPPTLLEIKTAAEKGDPEAQMELAELYESRLDYANALSWYRKAGDHGYTNAQFNAAEMLLNGRPGNANCPHGIVADANEAVAWLGRAANLGHAAAQATLGSCYRDGVSVNQDLIEAFKWFALASRQTNAVAQKALQELTLKLRSDEIAVGQSRADTFVPGRDTELPQPAYLDKLKLNGISVSRHNRLAIINNRTLGINEDTEIKLDTLTVEVRCLAINQQSVLVQVGPYRKQLQYRD
jgi:hypothetical protein